jgi:transcription elongation factor SPT5
VRHFVRGQYDGQHFGYSEPASEAAGLETCKCTLLSDESVVEEIPAEYIRPLRPTAPNQVVVVIQGDHGKGSQHTTQYRDEDAWAMQSTSGEIPAVLYSKDLCRIWKADV